jgi:hypothetical protein
MVSYILVSVTFAIGLISSLFEVKRKDKDGHVITGVGGLPKLTRFGIASLLLLSISFGFTLFSTVHTERDKNAATEANKKMAGDLAKTRDELATNTANLATANGTISNLAAQDLRQFEKVATDLRATGDQVSAQLHTASGAISQAVDDSAVDLDYNIRGSITPVKEFSLQLFFVGLPPLGTDTIPGFDSLRSITCDAPVDTKVEFVITLSDNPPLEVKAQFEKKGGHCYTNIMAIEPLDAISDEVRATPTLSWMQTYFSKPCDVTIYSGIFSPDNLTALTSRYSLNAASFRTRGRSQITATPADAHQIDKMQKYLQGRIPTVMGFSLTPTNTQNHQTVLINDLSTSVAFALDRVWKTAYFVSFHYEQTQFRPQWAVWDLRGARNLTEVTLPSEYRENRPRPQLSSTHLTDLQAHSLGAKCSMTIK